MRYSKLTMLIPCALLLSACTTVTPAYKDNGTRSGPCVEGGPDNVAQQFYDYRILHRSNDITALRPYLSDKLATLLSDASRDNNHRELLTNDPFSSRTTLPESARVASASTIPNRDARNIPVWIKNRVIRAGRSEVLMIQEGQCWVIDDVRYLGGSVHATAGTLRQSIENR
ncbi:lipoprotein [Escherichia coli]|nr:lipoprotein [Escherichia coli]